LIVAPSWVIEGGLMVDVDVAVEVLPAPKAGQAGLSCSPSTGMDRLEGTSPVVESALG